jgi:hypothetical protein
MRKWWKDVERAKKTVSHGNFSKKDCCRNCKKMDEYIF